MYSYADTFGTRRLSRCEKRKFHFQSACWDFRSKNVHIKVGYLEKRNCDMTAWWHSNPLWQLNTFPSSTLTNVIANRFIDKKKGCNNKENNNIINICVNLQNRQIKGVTLIASTFIYIYFHLRNCVACLPKTAK